MSESEQDLFYELIATYRDLNKRVRTLPEDRLTMSGGKDKDKERSVREVISQLRDSEMHFSQALKDAVSGLPMAEAYDYGKAPVIGTESESDTTVIILSQFGTARESTLAVLRGLTPEDWDRTVDGSPSIRSRVTERVSRDKRSMSDVVGLLGSP